VAGTAAGALFLIAFLAAGWSAALRDRATAAAAGIPILAVVLYVIALALLSEVLQIPFAFYQGVTLERRYGLSTQTTGQWSKDQGKAAAVGLVLALVAALIVWGLVRVSPERWWLIASGCFIVLLVAMAQLAPVYLLPLFYTFRPLDRPALVERLLRLAGRAGTTILGVFEWKMSEKTRKANAALTGIGQTRRILLSDTLLAEHSDDEIEVILAHELSHHVHQDIWKALAVEGVLLTLGLYVADRVLEMFSGRFGLMGKDDVAALPILLLAIGAVSILLLPVVNALSRAHERRADRYALDMTGNAAAFMSAMKRLGAQNLAEDHPSRLVEILFYSHPPMAARIESARAWELKRR
jgi:STE24 endopeptidase